MYNRKFDIQKDFSLLNEMENDIMPIVKSIENTENRKKLHSYIVDLFTNQFKK